jgi:site-specific DNA-methyltransferase (cytosine-N4-specific)
MGLINPDEIRHLDAGILGSREVISGRQQLEDSFIGNDCGLPPDVLRFCKKLTKSLSSSDGFRRQAVPVLLYRYLAGMKSTFTNLHRLVRNGGKMAWVVGVNQTKLGGTPIVIDTPKLLSSIASQAGFTVEDPIPLQTYQRYGLHQQNSIRKESILMFRR